MKIMSVKMDTEFKSKMEGVPQVQCLQCYLYILRKYKFFLMLIKCLTTGYTSTFVHQTSDDSLRPNGFLHPLLESQ